MQAPSQPLTQSASTAAPDRSAILAPPNLAPNNTDWISNASRIFKVIAGAGELDPSNIAKAIANIALPILELGSGPNLCPYYDSIMHTKGSHVSG